MSIDGANGLDKSSIFWISSEDLHQTADSIKGRGEVREKTREEEGMSRLAGQSDRSKGRLLQTDCKEETVRFSLVKRSLK